jgi:hypothetical protein
MASVIHQTIIHTEIAKTTFATSGIPSGVGINRIRKNKTGPRLMPNFLRLNFIIDNQLFGKRLI